MLGCIPVRWQDVGFTILAFVHYFQYNQRLSIAYFDGMICTGNLGNLLLIIIPAICEEEDNPFGDSDCSTNGEAYASLSLAVLYMILIPKFPKFFIMNACLI